MEVMEEAWRDIPGYEGLYQVSDLGRVKSLKFGRERIMKGSINSEGRRNFSFRKDLKRKNLKAHILVAIAFLGHVPCGHKVIVDHIDNNKLNDRLDNLQLTTQRHNMSKDRKNGTSKYTGVSWHKSTGKWFVQIYINGKDKYLGSFTDELDAAKAYQDALAEITKATS